MIKEIITDKEVLSLPCRELNSETTNEVVQDLLDTANANKAGCVGLAANQIGYLVSIFVFQMQEKGTLFVPVINPRILAVSKEIKSGWEFCLSFPGKRTKKRRHKWITLGYIDYLNQQITVRKFKDMEARIIQHELDHLKGVLM